MYIMFVFSIVIQTSSGVVLCTCLCPHVSAALRLDPERPLVVLFAFTFFTFSHFPLLDDTVYP